MTLKSLIFFRGNLLSKGFKLKKFFGLKGLLFYPTRFLIKIPDLVKSVLKVYLVLLLASKVELLPVRGAGYEPRVLLL